jgi:MYXO-CTERM domain-containing protein
MSGALKGLVGPGGGDGPEKAGAAAQGVGGAGGWRRRALSLHPTAVRVEQEGFRRMASLGSLL